MGIAFALVFMIVLVIIAIILISTFFIGLTLIIVGIIKSKINKKSEKKEKKNKILIIVGIILMICSSNVIIKTVDLFWITQEERAKMSEKKYKNSNTIIEALETEDVELMKTVFAENVKDDEFLDNQIKDMYEFIDGNIMYYTIGKVQSDGGSSYNGQIETYIRGSITDITTDKGKVYNLYFGECSRYTKDEDNEGVMYIRLISEDETYISTGKTKY